MSIATDSKPADLNVNNGSEDGNFQINVNHIINTFELILGKNKDKGKEINSGRLFFAFVIFFCWGFYETFNSPAYKFGINIYTGLSIILFSWESHKSFKSADAIQENINKLKIGIHVFMEINHREAYFVRQMGIYENIFEELKEIDLTDSTNEVVDLSKN